MVRSLKRKANSARGSSVESSLEVSNKIKKPPSLLQAVNNPDNTFGKYLADAGLTLQGLNGSNELNCDQVVFSKRLKTCLIRSPQKEKAITEFLDGLTDYWTDIERLRHSLGPTITSEDCGSSSRGKYQDNLVRLLLGIDCLQLPVASCLLEKLAEMSDDYDLQEFDYPHVIMSQFRWLDRIENGNELVEKMLEIVSVSSLAIQKEIITCIPDIIDDSKHGEVGNQLRDLMVQDSQLTTVVIDAIGNLNLEPKLLSEVRQSLMKVINSVSLDDLPVVLRFILQSSGEKEIHQVLKELRETLELSCLSPPTETSTPLFPRSRSSKESSELLTWSVIKSSVKFQRHVADAWVKSIEAVTDRQELKVLDIIVLFILHDISARKKAVENLIRAKVRAGILSEDLVQSTFDTHYKGLVDFFDEIMSIAENFMRSPEVIFSDFGSMLYKLSFTHFETSRKQDVVGALVTHVGSGIPGEIDAAFGVLRNLVFESTSEMVSFTMFVKNVLYYSETLELHHVRDLFSMLSILTLKESNGKSAIQDDVHMIIRKQLSSSVLRYKKIGIIGALMSIGSMARRTLDKEDSDPCISSGTICTTCLSPEIYKQVIHLLEMVQSSVKNLPRANALFYDELAQVVINEKLDYKVLRWISESVASDFQETFLIDAAVVKGSNDPQIEVLYDLDEPEEGGIAVNILPILLASESEAAGSSSSSMHANSSALICITPHFRLLGACEKALHNGSLEGIDALLGCPLVLFKRTVVDSIKDLNSNDKEIVCCALFFAINWIREVISTFASHKDSETKAKIMSRIATLTDLNDSLEKGLIATPSFVPPPAIFDADDTFSWKSPIVNNDKKPSKGAKKKRKAEKGEKDAGQTILDEAEKDGDDDSESICSDRGDEKARDLQLLSHYRPFLRELDISVFEALEYSSVSKAVYDTDLNTKENETISLKIPQLFLLLDDLEKKLEFSLLKQNVQRRSFLTKSSGSKNIGFAHLKCLSPEAFVKRVVEHFSAICGHLEAICAYFQTIAEDNDGVLDAPSLTSEQSKMMNACLRDTLSIFNTIFSWNGFNSAKHKPLLRDALNIIGRRLSVDDEDYTDLGKVARDASLYLEKISDSVHNVGTALLLVRLLQRLAQWCGTDSCKEHVGRLARSFLDRNWLTWNGDPEKGKQLNDAVLYFVGLKISCSEDQFAEIEELCSKPVAEFIENLEEKGDRNISNYATLTKFTVASYYKAMLEALGDRLKHELSIAEEGPSEKLLKMNIATKLFHMLISLVKAIENKAMMGIALKYGRIFLETILKLGMPVLDKTLRSNKDDVHGLLRSLQQSTRCLQHYCSHSKTYRDVAVTNHVPALKKCLESFVFRVKAMLAVNACQTAFWLGNLKNRDIQGNELSSQASRAEEGDEDADEVEEEAEGENDSEQRKSEDKDEDEEEEEEEEKRYSESF